MFGKCVISWRITFSKIRRFEDGSGTNLGGKKRQEVRKWSPRGTQDRRQTIQNRYKNRPRFRCENQEGLRGIGFQTLGRDPPGGAPGALGRGPKRHRTGPQAPMRVVKDIGHDITRWTDKKNKKEEKRIKILIFVGSFSLNFGLRVKDLSILDLKFGFYVKNPA